MSGDYALRFLIPAGSLRVERLNAVADILRRRGLTASAGSGVHVMSGDGSGSLLFSSLDGGIRWLSENDGLVWFVTDEDEDDRDALSLSLHRVDGALAVEMSHLPSDEPIFDELILDLDATSIGAMGAAWRVVTEDCQAIAAAVAAECAWLVGEQALEAAADSVVVHRRVAAGALPTLVGAAIAAPLRSRLAAELERVGRALCVPVTVQDGFALLCLSSDWCVQA